MYISNSGDLSYRNKVQSLIEALRYVISTQHEKDRDLESCVVTKRVSSVCAVGIEMRNKIERGEGQCRGKFNSRWLLRLLLPDPRA